MAYTIRTPDGKGYQIDAPEEGKLFKDTGGNVYSLKGGQLYSFSAEQALADKYGLGSISSTGTTGNTKWTDWLKSQGLTTGGAVQNRAYSELGIDPSKLSEYNLGDLQSYGVFTMPKNGVLPTLSTTDTQSNYYSGNLAKAAAAPTEVFGANIPKEISGANGPVTATGEAIKPEDYAKYGITNESAVAPTYQTKDTSGNVKIATAPPTTVAGGTPQQGTPEYRAYAESNAPAGTRYLGPTEFGGLTKEWTAAMNAAGVNDIRAINSVIEDAFLQRQGGDIYLKTGAISIDQAIQQAKDLQAKMTVPTINYTSPTSPPNTSGTYLSSDLLSSGTPIRNIGEQNVSDFSSGLSGARQSLYSSLESKYDIPGLKESIDSIKANMSTAELAVREADKAIQAYMDQAKLNYEGIQNQQIPQGIITGQLAHQQRLDSITLQALQGQKQLADSELATEQGNLKEAQALYQDALDKIDKSVSSMIDDMKWEWTQQMNAQEKKDDRAWELQKMSLQQQFNSVNDEADIIKAWAKQYPQAGDIIGTWRNEGFEAAAKLVSPFIEQTGNTGTTKPPSQAELQAFGYATRVENSGGIISNLEDYVMGLGTAKFMALSKSPNWLQPSEFQQYEQAKRDFVNAVLRRESGAAISASEFDSAEKQYFPQPGDSQAVIDQKRKNRDLALNSLIAQSGSAWDKNNGTTEGYNLPALTKSYSSLDALVKENPDYVNFVVDLSNQYPNASEEDLMSIIESGGGGFSNALTAALNQSYPQGATGGQCVTWLHKVADFPSIGDSQQSKIASVQKYGFTFDEQPPKVGDIIITNESKAYGHGAMIIALNPDGTATLAESNFMSPNKVSYGRKIPLNSSKIYGAIRPKSFKNLA